MRKLSIATLALAAAGFAAFAATAPSAEAGEYCREDFASGIRQCSFDTLAQCQANVSGRGGDCVRDPFLTSASNANAYAPRALNPKARKQTRE